MPEPPDTPHDQPPTLLESEAQPLRFMPIGGPALPPVVITGPSATIGRSLECDVRLAHQNVSRQHARLARSGDRWMISDTGSRHGTYLNSVRLDPAEAAPLAHGDLIRIDPWTFQIVITDTLADTDLINTIDDTDSGDARVEAVDRDNLGTLAQQRLDLIIECTGQLNAATDESSLSEIVLHSALAGTGFGRAAMLRPTGQSGTVEVLCFRRTDGGTREFSFSRSLIERAAASAAMVRLTTPLEMDISQSIADLRIQSALCVPIEVGETVTAYLYLDARGQESEVAADAAAFCQALGKITGLALADLKRDELEQRRRALEDELRAARHAQQLIIPPARGELGGIRYALRIKPGRFVAGDLFDIVALSDTRAAVCIGDVTGEGVGAGILMTGAQSHLEATLLDHADPAAVMHRLNRWVVDHSPADRFISLWLGIFDRGQHRLSYVDAGHGHWLMIAPDQSISTEPREHAGIPLGIDPDFTYSAAEITLDPASRIILYSDGLIEQRTLDGDQFGLGRVHRTLAGTTTVDQVVDRLFEAVFDTAGTQSLDDDTTVAAVGWG